MGSSQSLEFLESRNEQDKQEHLAKLISIPAPRKNPRLRLYCFPYAGGSISSFAIWSQLLPADIEIAVITLPGRGSRLIEPAYSSMSEIVDDLFEVFCKQRFAVPSLFYGHSMGARVAYELMSKMQSRSLPLPAHFFASGSIAPTRPRKKKTIHQLPDEKFIHKLGKMNATSREVLANTELASLLLPSLRADFKIVETYSCTHVTKLNTGVSVFAGEHDDEAKGSEISPWHDLFARNTGLHWFAGNHFFVDSHRTGVCKEILLVLKNLAFIQ